MYSFNVAPTTDPDAIAHAARLARWLRAALLHPDHQGHCHRDWYCCDATVEEGRA